MKKLDSLQLELRKRLFETEAIRFRNSDQDLPFWYTSGRPGPYYVNVERIAGPSSVQSSLGHINEVLYSNMKLHDKSVSIEKIVLQQLGENAEYAQVVENMVGYYQKAIAQFLSKSIEDGKPSKVSAISGGERRDWFFSIPFAHLLHLPHLFLFKNGEHCLQENMNESSTALAQQTVVHVSDIVNTGASYERQWLPTLRRLQVHTPFTFAAVVRGTYGKEVLERHGLQLLSPLELNLDLFQESLEQGLISQFAKEDISLYIQSPTDWTRHLLQTTGSQILSHLHQFSEVEQRRAYAFVAEDPLQLGSDFPDFFAQVKQMQDFLH